MKRDRLRPGPLGPSVEVVERLWEIRAKEGLSDRALARRLVLGLDQVKEWVGERGGIRPRPRKRASRCLTLAEREEILLGIAREETDHAIGRRLGRSHSTIGREIHRNGGRRRYRPHRAEATAWRRARRPKQTKLELSPELRRVVWRQLRKKHSPEQISGWLALVYPDNEDMQVSHEAIYRALYLQARGQLKRELASHLRTRRMKRRPRSHSRHGEGRGKITDMVLISERPPEIEDRAVPGHWEGDLLLGTKTSGIATLVERQTRYCQLVALPEGMRAEPVREALVKSITTLPEQLRRSLTWDQGREMSQHRLFSVESGVEVYFCDPQSPWQRGTNENTNGLLRQYFPKGKSLRGVNQEHLDEVAAQLNGRPRKTLEFRTPAEKLTELIDGLDPASAGR